MYMYLQVCVQMNDLFNLIYIWMYVHMQCLGTIEVILRTSDSRRFPGFSATVVCVSTTLLSRATGK